MPDALPPATVAQAPAPAAALPGGMIERDPGSGPGVTVWRVELRPTPRERPPCPEAKASEIVVCAPKEDDPARDRLGPPLPDPPTTMDDLTRAMTVKLGPGEMAPGGGAVQGIPDAAPWIGVKFKIKF